MPPPGELLPAWFDRAVMLLLLTVVGTIAAFVSSGVLLALGFGGGELFVASIANHPLVVVLSLGCGVVVGLAGASARTWAGTLRRAGVAALVLLALGAGAMAAFASLPRPAFDAASFRSAAASGDDEEMERQAYRAVEQDVLLGLGRTEARRVLGEPDRISGTRDVWTWDVGMINDAIGPGDGGRLYVIFDPSGRVRSAKVDTSL